MSTGPDADAKITRLDALATEGRNTRSGAIDTLSATAIVSLINQEDAAVATGVGAQAESIAAAIEAIVERMRRGGRLIYIGAGTSGRLGVLDASECPPTFNTPPGLVVGLIAGGDHALRHAVENAEDSGAEGARDLHDIGVGVEDAVVGIAASGRTPYVLGAVDGARAAGALTIGLACTTDSELSRRVDIMIAPIVGPEVITGSTRLKAGTAQKMVLNMLSTGSMVLLGKTYGNLMVDLRATNTKLRQRAIGIVRDAVDTSEDRASALLAASGEEVKTAIVSGILDIEPDEARRRLARAAGIVRAALEGSSR
ncbi:MAG: N-acetylmuramic acid 6-phosphate etherase [Chloroflexia bacterium]|nr:N-acetylmuramic acid 6-phosphate etherase [Chloroflexia bacterium]